MTEFLLWGSGWRAQFYLRIAAALPRLFRVCAVVEPDPARIQRLNAEYSLPVYPDYGSVPEDRRGCFAVLSLPKEKMPAATVEMVKRRAFVLTETWPTDKPEQVIEFYGQVARGGGERLIQVAEQYTRQPMHRARLELLKQGVLGRVYQAQVSCAHGYHGVSLLLNYLGLGFEPCQVEARVFSDNILRGPGRRGYAETPEYGPDTQTLALLDFGGHWGALDFTDEQYFSPVRRNRLLVRGEKGELDENEARFFTAHGTPVIMPFCRQTYGRDASVGSTHLTCVTAGERALYRYPYGHARLNDDETAVAALLTDMASYVNGGPPAYSFAEGCRDMYLDACIRQAIEKGRGHAVQAEWKDFRVEKNSPFTSK